MIQQQQINWKQFRIEEIFEITGTITTHPSILRVKGETPRITCAATDNGLDGFYQNKPTEKGNVLTIDSATIGFVSYQETDFLATDHVEKLIFKGGSNFNRYIGLFIKKCIDSAKGNKFGYGYKFSQCRIKRQTIMLPAKNGKPDYAYMEAYMRNVEQILLKRHKEYLTSVMPSQEPEKVSIDGKKWKAFFMNEVFDIKSSVRLTKDDMVVGNRPFIGASDSNNGVTAFVGNTNNSLDSNVLGVNYNGSVVHNFYHPYEAIFSDDVKRLHFKHYKDDKYAYLFVKQAILQQKSKFEYGYKFNGERMKRQQILLPITISGEPDYDFMSAYMKRLEYDMQRRYMKYIPLWA